MPRSCLTGASAVLRRVPPGCGPHRAELRRRRQLSPCCAALRVAGRSANAVGCNHPPGFKSPILRQSAGPLLERAGIGPALQSNRRLQFRLQLRSSLAPQRLAHPLASLIWSRVLRTRASASPAGLTARARPEARPERRAANLRAEYRLDLACLRPGHRAAKRGIIGYNGHGDRVVMTCPAFEVG